MSDTPKTDAARISAWGEGGIESSIGFTTVPVDFARTLERENAALREALSRLIEVHDAMGGKCGTARIAAEETLAKGEGK